MRLLVRSALFVTAHLAFVGTVSAQSLTYEDEGPATLTVCNHGTRSVSVALGSIDVNPDQPRPHGNGMGESQGRRVQRRLCL